MQPIRKHLFGAALLLAPLLAGCQDRTLPTASPPEGASFDHVGASYVVTNTNDSGEGSLRYAIEHLDAGGTISFDPALHGETIELTSAQLTIDKDLTISGPGADLLTVQRNSAAAFRIFQIDEHATVNISAVTIANGLSDEGGGIRNDGTLTLQNSRISGNSARGVFNSLGGGIANRHTGTLTVRNSTISDNLGATALALGGGIFNEGRLTLTHSTVSGNRATGVSGSGGGIFSWTSGDRSTTILNSTVSDNTANTGGGIYNNSGLTRILHSTITANEANWGGGVQSVGSTEVGSSLIAENTDQDGDPDVYDSFTSRGHNFIGIVGDNATGFTAPGDQTGTASDPWIPWIPCSTRCGTTAAPP